MMRKIRLGEILTAQNVISDEELSKALVYAKNQGLPLGQAVILLGLATEEAILQALASQIHSDYIDLETADIDHQLIEHAPVSLIRRFSCLPIREDADYLYLATNDPLNLEAQEAFGRHYIQKPIRLVLAKLEQIQHMIGKIALSENIRGLIADVRRELASTYALDGIGGDSSSIYHLIQIIIDTAVSNRASDIHIEPSHQRCIIRCRIDGMLSETFSFDNDIYPPLASRLKLLSNLDIAERRKPQDGRFSMIVDGKEYDFRISTLPIVDGESIVMRILDKTKLLIRLEEAGMSQTSYERLTRAIQAPHGIIFVTGPTGSGKTTTLYGVLNAIKTIDRKLITVEDPVEYHINMIQQVQVNEHTDLTFANTLRSILRQDPDIIMIGEVRDKETLRIAVQAALTGHLVFSTLHTNDAVSAVVRVLDMGIEPYLISGALVAIQAQRLVRRVCPHCAEEIIIPPTTLSRYEEFFIETPHFRKGIGCSKCAHTGYLGREMISEVLSISETISTLIARGATKKEILTQAYTEGFEPMIADGMRKVSEGITTIEEVLRVTKE